MRRWEDVRRCEKMWRWEDEEKMGGWEDVKMRRCEDEKMWRCEDEKMWRWEDVKMWRWEDVKMRRCEDEKMWRWEDVKMRGCEDEKMFYRPPLLEEPCAQTLSGKTTCKSSRNYLGLLVRILEPLVKVLETTYTHKHWFLMVLGYLTNLNPSIQMILDRWIFQTLVCQVTFGMGCSAKIITKQFITKPLHHP